MLKLNGHAFGGKMSISKHFLDEQNRNTLLLENRQIIIHLQNKTLIKTNANFCTFLAEGIIMCNFPEVGESFYPWSSIFKLLIN